MPPKSNIKRVPRITMVATSPGRPGLRSGGSVASDAAADAAAATEDVQPPIDNDASLAADSDAAPTASTAPEDSLGDTSSKQNLQDNPSKEDDTTAMDVEPTTKEDATSTVEETSVANRTQNVQSETADESPVHSTNDTGKNDADNSTNAKDVPSTPTQSKTAIDPPKSKEKELESFISATTNNNPRVNVSYSMLPFLLLLDVDQNDELTIGMPNVNWNVINMDVALELFLKMIGNPYQRKDGNQAKPMTHDMVLLMVQTDDKVSEPHYHRPMPLARTSIFREKIVKM